jgi:hypothetical protein
MADTKSMTRILAGWKREGLRVLVMTSCSSLKSGEDDVPARRLYQGQLFKAVADFATLNGFDLAILSSKYGLIPGNEMISCYDKHIKERSKDEEFKILVDGQFARISKHYDKFIVVMGEAYRKFLKKQFDGRFLVISDDRGIGGYKQTMKQLIDESR